MYDENRKRKRQSSTAFENIFSDKTVTTLRKASLVTCPSNFTCLTTSISNAQMLTGKTCSGYVYKEFLVKKLEPVETVRHEILSI